MLQTDAANPAAQMVMGTDTTYAPAQDINSHEFVLSYIQSCTAI